MPIPSPWQSTENPRGPGGSPCDYAAKLNFGLACPQLPGPAPPDSVEPRRARSVAAGAAGHPDCWRSTNGLNCDSLPCTCVCFFTQEVLWQQKFYIA